MEIYCAAADPHIAVQLDETPSDEIVVLWFKSQLCFHTIFISQGFFCLHTSAQVAVHSIAQVGNSMLQFSTKTTRKRQPSNRCVLLPLKNKGNQQQREKKEKKFMKQDTDNTFLGNRFNIKQNSAAICDLPSRDFSKFSSWEINPSLGAT